MLCRGVVKPHKILELDIMKKQKGFENEKNKERGGGDSTKFKEWGVDKKKEKREKKKKEKRRVDSALSVFFSPDEADTIQVNTRSFEYRMVC